MSGDLYDRDIRAPLLAYLRTSAVWIREEFPIAYAIADVVAIEGGLLCAYEIKSDHDSAARLPLQTLAYGQACDHVTVICTRARMPSVLRAVPPWWGVWLAKRGPDGVALEPLREGGRSDHWHARAAARLLWADELRATLEARGIARGVRGRSRPAMVARLLEHVEGDALRQVVRDALLARRYERTPAAAEAGA